MTELGGIVTVSVYRQRRSCIMTCVAAPLNLPWFQSPVNSVDPRYPSKDYSPKGDSTEKKLGRKWEVELNAS